MKTPHLLPHRFKMIGWIIFIPALILGLITLCGLEFDSVLIPVVYNSGFPLSNEATGFFRVAEVDLMGNVAGILIIVGGLLVGFSREDQEDEYISSLRLQSVFWSLIISYAVILILFVSIFGGLFFTVMLIAVYLPLILYILRFNYLLLKK
ncbi:MAG: hypothetical protein K0M63_09250 [Weeksellaceae bacterium]|nr:hypothetical protein [Weeksellaceae bacterium]